jgi:hypothetical protein
VRSQKAGAGPRGMESLNGWISDMVRNREYHSALVPHPGRTGSTKTRFAKYQTIHKEVFRR